MPRRTAYPRIAPYDSVYSAVEGLPLRFMANSEADVSVERRPDGSAWVNVCYPRYLATIYCTLTPVGPGTVDAVIDNRAERIHRNLGTAQPQFLEFDNASGFFSDVVVTPSAPATPVQFLSYDSADPHWVVSGSAFIGSASSDVPLDSVMPIIDVMKRDIVYLLDNIAPI